MRKLALVLTVAFLPLAGCNADTSGNEKQIGDLTNELQRVRADSDRQKEKIATLERRLNGLTDDLGRSRRSTVDTVAVAPAPEGTVNADGSPVAAAAADPAAIAAALSAQAPVIKSFLESEDGRKSVAAAVKAVQDQQEQERAQRMVDAALARLVRDAQLTEDQTKKMKDVMDRAAAQLRPLFTAMRDGGGDPTAEGRQATMAKFAEIRTTANAEAKVVLSQTQYDVFEKQTAQQFGGFGGPGGGRPGGRQPGGNNQGN